MIPSRFQTEQMVNQMDASIARLQLRLAWNSSQPEPPSQPGRPLPESVPKTPAPPPFTVDIQLHLDTVDTLVALGVKRSLAQELDIDAVGKTVGDRVAFALRHSK